MAREMTESSFDELAKGLASGSISRGRAIRLMGAALVGGTLGSFGIGGVAAADNLCKPTGKKCNKNKQCCSGNCSGGKCAACPSGQVLCNGSCVSTSCPEGQTFNPTSCQCECPSGQVLCSNGSCVSTSCPEGQILNTTTCQCGCPSGQVLCSNGSCGLPNGGTCTANTQCCSGTCLANGICAPCRFTGSICAPGDNCCDGTCENGKCCAPMSHPCRTDDDCCGSLHCGTSGCGK